MGFLKKLKPKLVNIDLHATKPEQIIYFCKTQVIDKKICLLKGLEFNQELADKMEKPYPFYFVVKSNMNYDVISGLLFDEFVKVHNMQIQEANEKANKCIRHYIQSLK